MPNKGYFIQQMTRHGAGTLFGISGEQDKQTVPNVKKILVIALFSVEAFVTREYPSDLTESEWNTQRRRRSLA